MSRAVHVRSVRRARRRSARPRVAAAPSLAAFGAAVAAAPVRVVAAQAAGQAAIVTGVLRLPKPPGKPAGVPAHDRWYVCEVRPRAGAAAVVRDRLRSDRSGRYVCTYPPAGLPTSALESLWLEVEKTPQYPNTLNQLCAFPGGRPQCQPGDVQLSAARAIRVDTVIIARTDRIRIRDTVFVDRPLPPPPPRVDTVRIAPPPPPVRTVFFGVSTGAAFPLARTRDVAVIGPQLTGMVDVHAPGALLGLRIDGAYQLLSGRNLGQGYSAAPPGNAARPSLGVYSATINGVIRVPFGRDSTGADHGGFYLFGGGGGAYLRSFFQDAPPVADIERNLVRPLAQGGVGIEFGGPGAATLFLEGRVVHVFTPGQRVTSIPVGLGIRF